MTNRIAAQRPGCLCGGRGSGGGNVPTIRGLAIGTPYKFRARLARRPFVDAGVLATGGCDVGRGASSPGRCRSSLVTGLSSCQVGA